MPRSQKRHVTVCVSWTNYVEDMKSVGRYETKDAEIYETYHAVGAAAVAREVVAAHLRDARGLFLERGLEHGMGRVDVQLDHLEQVAHARGIDLGKLELQMAHELRSWGRRSSVSMCGFSQVGLCGRDSHQTRPTRRTSLRPA
jgi:hypothetical protein